MSRPLICVAGKNDIAVAAVRHFIDHYPDHPLCFVSNVGDTGVDGWQPSLLKRATDWGVRRVALADLYEVEDLIFFSLEFDTLIKTPKFASRRLFNFHFSKLPKYRGMYTAAHPILNGDDQTGVTLHLIDDGIDTGDIIDSCDVEITIEDTVRDLYFKNLAAARGLFERNVARLVTGDVIARPQPTAGASYYSKHSIDYRNLVIDLKKTAFEIHNQFRAFTFREFQMPTYGGWGISRTVITQNRSTARPGRLVEETDRYFVAASIDNDVQLYKDYYGPLWRACETGDLAAVTLALNHVDRVDLRNSKGWTALIIAAYNGRLDIMRMLLDRGASPDATNHKGTTVLMYALSCRERSGDAAPFACIAAKCAGFDATDVAGKSVFDYIREKGLTELLRLIPDGARGG